MISIDFSNPGIVQLYPFGQSHHTIFDLFTFELSHVDLFSFNF